MWQGVELRELRVFLTLADELHFGRTAERLHLTPSRVSQSLRELEQKLGGQLVHRTTRRVALTPLGERFRDEAGAAYEQLSGVLEQTHAENRTLDGTLRLGVFSAASGGPHLLAIVDSFEARHPECHVLVEATQLSEPFEPLHRGEIDLMATWVPHGQRGLVDGPILNREPRVLAVARDHPLAERGAVSLEDLADHQVVRFGLAPKELNEAWVPPRTPSGRPIPEASVAPQARDDRGQLFTELAYMVAGGKIVYPTVPSIEAYWGHPDIVYIPITDMPPISAALVWRRRASNRRLREFIRVAEDVLTTASTHRDPE
jgi:DNA-binding transcriptional LysR family regulator